MTVSPHEIHIMNIEHDEEFWRLREMESMPFWFFFGNNAWRLFFGCNVAMKILPMPLRSMVDHNWEINHWYPLVPSPNNQDWDFQRLGMKNLFWAFFGGEKIVHSNFLCFSRIPVTSKILTPPQKANMSMENPTIWRCISYWKVVDFPYAMLVFRGVHFLVGKFPV